MQNKSIIAMVPARIGSTRLPMKNLALLAGRPLVSYALQAAKDSNAFSRVVLNGDHEVFRSVAEEYGVEFYLRPAALGASSVKSDDVVFDFMEKHPCEIVCWVNSIAPLQQPEEINNVVSYFIEEKLDTLFTVEEKKVHGLFKGEPINFTTNGKFSQTQDLTPVSIYSYSIMMWRCKAFIEGMNKRGFAFYAGKVGHYPISKRSSIIIKTKEDLFLAEAMYDTTNKEVVYHKSVKDIKIGNV